MEKHAEKRLLLPGNMEPGIESYQLNAGGKILEIIVITGGIKEDFITEKRIRRLSATQSYQLLTVDN